MGGRIQTGGQIQVSQNHLPPNSDFYSDFAHFILEILGNINFWLVFRKKSLKIKISGGMSSRNSELGGCVPPIPLVVMPIYNDLLLGLTLLIDM